MPESKEDEDIEFIAHDLERPDQRAKIRAKLSVRENEFLTKVLLDNIDVFTYLAENMPRIDPRVICHKLYVYPNFKLVI